MCPVLFTTLKTIKRKKIKLCTKLKQIVFIQLEGNKSCDVPSESAVNTYNVVHTEHDAFCQLFLWEA